MKTKVLINGGGAAGLALALKLGINGFECAVIDPKTPNTYDFTQHGGRTAALMGQSVELLKSLSLWDEITVNTAPLETMQIIDDGNPALDPIKLLFSAKDIDQENFGHNVPNCYLRALLYQAVQENENITCLIPNKLESLDIQPSCVIATLDNEQKISADIIVGADGRFSKIRDLANIGVKEIDYEQIAMTCLISHEKSHQNISTEHL